MSPSSISSFIVNGVLVGCCTRYPAWRLHLSPIKRKLESSQVDVVPSLMNFHHLWRDLKMENFALYVRAYSRQLFPWQVEIWHEDGRSNFHCSVHWLRQWRCVCGAEPLSVYTYLLQHNSLLMLCTTTRRSCEVSTTHKKEKQNKWKTFPLSSVCKKRGKAIAENKSCFDVFLCSIFNAVIYVQNLKSPTVRYAFVLLKASDPQTRLSTRRKFQTKIFFYVPLSFLAPD